MGLDQIIINCLLGLLGVVLAYLLNSTWRSINELKEADRSLTSEVNQVKVLVAGEYVKQDKFDRTTAALFKKLDRIEDKLDGKVDKSP